MKVLIEIELEAPEDFYESAAKLIPYHDALRAVKAPDGLTVVHFRMHDTPPNRRKPKAPATQGKAG